MAFQSGETLLFPLNLGSVAHLWVVLTETNADSENLLVNLTTRDNCIDDTVILTVGDYPFIRHETSVRYSDVALFDATLLENSIRSGHALRREKCSPALLKKIQKGVLLSPFTPEKYQTYLKKALKE